MWSDNETSEDLLGFKIHADLLSEVIKDDSVLPITIGIFGDWGSGKSSILKMIYEKLTSGEKDQLKDNTLVLYFNGWVFEGYDDAKAALLESIIEQFKKHKKLGPKVKDKTTKLLKSIKWMRVLGLGFKKIVLPGAAAFMTGGISLVPYLIHEFSNFNPEDLAKKLTGEDADKFLKEIINKTETDETTLVREFRDDFKEMINKSGIDKLIVIIDDLDRCTPDRIIENLEAIKLFLNVEKTAFIIGADPRIVRNAIEYRYNTDNIERANDPDSRNKRIVSDYLEKLIQLPYNLPKLSDREVETYMTLLFCKKALPESTYSKILVEFNKNRASDRYGAFGFGDMQEIPGLLSNSDKKCLSASVSLIASLAPIITDGLNGNPRQIKRFLNTFTIRKRLVDVANIQDFKMDVLIKLMVLEYSNLGLFKILYNWQVSQNGEPEEIMKLEEAARGDNLETIKNLNYASDWGSDKLFRWLKIDPQLTGVDLRDYFWLSRDNLEKSISGSSLIPPAIRQLSKKLMGYGSESILKNIVSEKVIKSLEKANVELLLSLLEKELLKAPENIRTHKIFIELMSQKAEGAIESYKRIIPQVDNDKIPFSLASAFKLAVKVNQELNGIEDIFNRKSKIYISFLKL